ncbi:DUF4124 domain-containing protein [Desulfobotulus sp. H1]|uniref:DUF4124 domain-containing protein n=1 Tax=Desulfobotulus pelophilus TaxID=2823377 RepID=A0ABT3N541_9BACT|nr:DUF4124 domain-containing protein [Desulfobotulus pelophilus]MCW7752574.1 DUF4124 domain-containing protein [Desulfobotulus pelophilus]
MQTGYRSFISVVVVFFFACGAGAEFYQYRDASGRIVFTDDLSRLPEAGREVALRFESHRPLADTVGEEVDANVPSGTVFSESAADLEAEQKELGEALSHLKVWREALEDQFETLGDADRQIIAAYNEEVAAFDAELRAYEQKRQQHNEKVRAFNAVLAEMDKGALQDMGTP